MNSSVGRVWSDSTGRRCGGMEPDINNHSGNIRPRRVSSLVTSKQARAPMLWPKKEKGRPRYGSMPSQVWNANSSIAVKGDSLKRVSRPGSWTQHTSTPVGRRSERQEINALAPPPAYGKQNNRIRAAESGTGPRIQRLPETIGTSRDMKRIHLRPHTGESARCSGSPVLALAFDDRAAVGFPVLRSPNPTEP